jgi:hypothetical protein
MLLLSAKRSAKFSPAKDAPAYTGLILFCLLLLGAIPAFSSPDHPIPTAGMTREFAATAEEVRHAVVEVVHDQIIHGTLVFDREPILTGAEAVDSTPLFDPWSGPGEVYYKVRKNAVAPRHFLQTADQGTIAVRFVLIPVNADRTRVRIDAIYAEGSHHVVHASDGTVEKSEMKEIKERIESAQEAAQEAADAKRRKASAELVYQTYQRQREDESTRLSTAQNAEKLLEEQVTSVRHEVERRVKAPGTELKAAPYRAAANLKTLPANLDVLVLIVTPHWLGVETPEGQRGWIPEENLEQLR